MADQQDEASTPVDMIEPETGPDAGLGLGGLGKADAQMEGSVYTAASAHSLQQSDLEDPTQSANHQSFELSIEVPRVQRRWEYQVFASESIVSEIIRKVDDLDGEVSYEVSFKNQEEDTIPYSSLLKFPNASKALLSFNKSSHQQRAHYKGVRGQPTKSSTMVSTRQTRSKRPTAPDFVNSSTMDFSSDEDELVTGKTTKPRTTRISGFLSAPKATGSSRGQQSEAVSSISSPASEDSLPDRFGSHGSKAVYGAGESRATQFTRSSTRLRLRHAADESSRSESEDDADDGTDKSSSEDSMPYLYSDIVPPTKAQLRKRKRARTSKAGGSKKSRLTLKIRNSDQGSPAEGTRRSGRSGRPMQSMKERGEDDIYASESETETATLRAVGAREIFKDLPRHNDFRLRHCQFCDTCGIYGNTDSKGKLVFCQGCTLSYHRTCLGPRNQRDHLVTKIGDGDFVLQCRRCVGAVLKKDQMAPRQDTCHVCRDVGPACGPFRNRKTAKQEEKEREDNDGQDPVTEVNTSLINDIDNVLFRCMGCWRAMHFLHLPPRGEDDEMDADASKVISDQRFQEYCRDWRCKDCVDMPAKVVDLVAWRPVDEESYIPGYTTEMVNEDGKEYLVKWEKLSYFRTTWMPGAWVWGVTALPTRKAFVKRDNGSKLPNMNAVDAIPEEYLSIDIVLDVRYSSIVDIHAEEVDKARIGEVKEALVKFKGLEYEDAVWEVAPGPEDGERWMDFVKAYDDWVMGRYVQLPKQGPLKDRLQKARSLDFESKIRKKAQPKNLIGGEMMSYQMEGLNWLLYNWYRRRNAILADEMGLGKTIQVIGLLATLVQDHRCWPFLVVVPNSTCPNWRREIKQWAPSLRVVTYFGSSEARQTAYKYELFPEGSKDLRCHIVVTSYDAAANDDCRRFFRSVPWAGLIVDEGQRLKNDKSLLYEALRALDAPFRVLLTGTPLQNNARELFNLLQFLDKSINASALEAEYADLTQENVPRLREFIKPFFLRRTKANVLNFLPPMAQIIIPVTMSLVQKKLYRSILAKNPELIKSIFGREKHTVKERHNLNNILMQLRKCLCHPFVYSQAIEERSSNTTVSHRNLVEASSKLQLLEIMLPKLREGGHRVLIFSQFLDMLDMIEDFLDGLELPFHRLDGNVSSLQKQRRIDEFNAPDSPLFAFLLSTRAGGVGINLATADTVIIMDPDFNPYQDIQALSRAHRIGQKNKVLVFQLMTRDSAEEKIVQIGRKKMALDHVLIEQMDAEDDAGMDLESVLRHGAAALFEDNSDRDIKYDSASVDKLLDRSQAENTQAGEDKSAESTFSYARIWANDQGRLEDDLEDTETKQRAPDPTMWDKILKDREKAAAKEAAARQEILGRGKRRRQAVDYTKHTREPDLDRSSPTKYSEHSDSDTDFQAKAMESEAEDTGEEGGDGEEVDANELRNADAGRTRGIAGSQTSSVEAQAPQTFVRAKVPAINRSFSSSYIAVPAPEAPIDESLDLRLRANRPSPCVACDQIHKRGSCPLKVAGVEYCGLCGLAHYGSGYNRTCPHINSETQVRLMLETLKQSTESMEYREMARKYLRGVVGSLVSRKKRQTDSPGATIARIADSRTMNGGILSGRGHSNLSGTPEKEDMPAGPNPRPTGSVSAATTRSTNSRAMNGGTVISS
ncbi:MAG: hypothetical protein M1827_003665 [Pycnora praestabilis]|nr:MAG: hypothetical protein M1827_003665 [Pycnora praestabilis]